VKNRKLVETRINYKEHMEYLVVLLQLRSSMAENERKSLSGMVKRK
jgi:hypothetical protein